MRVAAVVPEAFGGRGGIALYDTDLLTAICELEICEGVTALPRVIRDRFSDALPDLLEFRTDAARGAVSFVTQWLRLLGKARQFDLVLCGHINLLPFAEALRRRAGVPLVLVIYGIEAWQKPDRRFDERLAKGVDAVISISDLTRQRFAAWSGVDESSIFLLPNALHPEFYGAGGKPEYLEDRYRLRKRKVIMTLGRLSSAERYKGFDEIIEILPALLSDDPDIRYLVVGDGDDRQRLEARAKALGVAPRVVFAGWIDEAEKADHYRLADAFVMAGRGEGFGFVFLEAMACGIPVVASCVDGSREAVLNGKLGRLADPDSREELRAAIRQALKSPREVPQGLEHFHYPRFRERLGDILDAVNTRSARVA